MKCLFQTLTPIVKYIKCGRKEKTANNIINSVVDFEVIED